MIHWFPDRKFILLGDGGFASHELALFCHRHRRHVTLIARFCGDARLHARPDHLPKKRGGLFTLVSSIYAKLARDRPLKLQTTCCYAKSDPTFADALAAVRRVIWEKIILPRTTGGNVAAQLPRPLKKLLLDHLTAAA